MILSTGDPNQMQIGNSLTKGSFYVKVLGIKFGPKSTFGQHIKIFCKKTKAKAKLEALARVVSYMELARKKLLMNSIFAVQFNYCPLISMIHSCFNNNRVQFYMKMSWKD